MEIDYKFLQSNFTNHPAIISDNTKIWDVSQLSNVIKSILEKNFDNIYLKGEISQLYYHKISGHLYFTLKDEKSVINCVLFKQVLKKLDFKLAKGLDILIQGSITAYPPRGSYQIVLSNAFLGDKGILDIRFEQLKKKLTAEGLFDEVHKKNIPKFIRKVGIISGWQSDALKDIINISHSRFNKLEYYILPANVSGKKSADDLASAIKVMDKHAKSLMLDVIIIARGGGSQEELQGFNEEVLVRAIFKCKTPVISAIGHQQNISLADLAADKNAATPSEAAFFITLYSNHDIENIIKLAKNSLANRLANTIAENQALINHKQQLLKLALQASYRQICALFKHALFKMDTAIKQPQGFKKLNHLRWLLNNQVMINMGDKKNSYNTLKARLMDIQPQKNINLQTVNLNHLEKILHTLKNQAFGDKKNRLKQLADQLSANNPDSIMKKGYTIVSKDDQIINNSTHIKTQTPVTITWHDGARKAVIKESVPKKIFPRGPLVNKKS